MDTPAARLTQLRSRLPAMVDAVAGLVGIESPSSDVALLEQCAAAVGSVGEEATGSAGRIVRVGDHPHLEWRFGRQARVVLIGHFDTVWPAGTIAERPFTCDGNRMTGPGTFDMKVGIVQLFEALRTLEDLTGVTVVLTSDEELGSPTSRTLVEAAAAGASAALVLEPSVNGALKTSRKGTGMYTLRVVGRAAHAGLEPEKGANALVAAAHLVLAVERLARPEVGTTVTPTMASSGTASNVVPDCAVVEVDVRVESAAEAARVDAAVRALASRVPGTSVQIDGGPNRPPMPPSCSESLLARAQACAQRLGLAPVEGRSVGGGSDGNFTAAVGTPTLDGLGAVGDGAHGAGEYALVHEMAERAALVAELVADLLGRGSSFTPR